MFGKNEGFERNPVALPEIPKQSHPEYDFLIDKGMELVKQEIESLNLDLDLEKQPELLKRLAELGGHFRDSSLMAQIINSDYEDFRQNLGLSEPGPEKMMRAAILHDLGKSGPPEAPAEMRYAVRRLFSMPRTAFNPFDPEGEPKTISDFVVEQDLPDAEKIEATLSDNGIDPSEQPVLDFWRKHVEWTHELLEPYAGGDLGEDTVRIAASHHLIEGKNPAGIDFSEKALDPKTAEVISRANVLETVDKYQALRKRGGLSHDEAIARLKAVVEKNSNVPDWMKENYGKAIDVLDKNH